MPENKSEEKYSSLCLPSPQIFTFHNNFWNFEHYSVLSEFEGQDGKTGQYFRQDYSTVFLLNSRGNRREFTKHGFQTCWHNNDYETLDPVSTGSWAGRLPQQVEPTGYRPWNALH